MEPAVLIKELICTAKLMRLFAQDKIYSVGKKNLKKIKLPQMTETVQCRYQMVES